MTEKVDRCFTKRPHLCGLFVFILLLLFYGRTSLTF